MGHQSDSQSDTGLQVFPQFGLLYDWVASEVEGLSEIQLSWRSGQWAWSEWSIRIQVSHIASFFYGWLLERWGLTLFPTGLAELGPLADYTKSKDGWWMDESRYPDLSSLLQAVKDGLALANHVLARETPSSMQNREIARPEAPPLWRLLDKAHPYGTRWTDPDTIHLSLEATFRHLYYEALTHLYNIQRLKRAQGLPTSVVLPFEGYWALPEWDRSEA